MTSEEYDALTDEERQIKVAELCGWDCVVINVDEWIGKDPDDDLTKRIPDYLHDLNAMYEAEARLNDMQYDEYWNTLVYLCVTTGWERMNSTTAAQRAKAFVLTITGGRNNA